MNSKIALSPPNLAILGALDDFYDLYCSIWASYDREYQKFVKERNGRTPSLGQIEARIASDLSKLCEPILFQYSFLFVDPPRRIHANTWFINHLSLFHQVNSHSLEFKQNSFHVFLEELQSEIVAYLCRRNNKENNPVSYPSLYETINKRITSIVEQAKPNRFSSVISPDTPYDAKDKTLYIYEQLSSTNCSRHKHHVIPSTYSAPLFDGSGILFLPTHYCIDCNKYFIGKKTLSVFEKQYGPFCIEKQYENVESNGFSGFQAESRLHRLGYQVLENGMTEAQRHALLAFLLDHNIITYFEMCKTIELDIQLFGNSPSHFSAISKWKKDLKYIGEYVLGKS